MRRAVTAFGWAATIGAPLATHFSLTTGRLFPLALALSAVQVVTLASVALRRRQAGAGVVAGAMVVLLLLRFIPDAQTSGLVATSGVSHAVIYLSLLALFSASLRGPDDLITALARRLRGRLTPGMLAYTRGVTIAWCGFFAAQLAGSALLFVLAPRAVWSLFVNVLDFPLVVLMFATEYGVRRLRFRNYPHISIVETIRSFSRGSPETNRP